MMGIPEMCPGRQSIQFGFVTTSAREDGWICRPVGMEGY